MMEFEIQHNIVRQWYMYQVVRVIPGSCREYVCSSHYEKKDAIKAGKELIANGGRLKWGNGPFDFVEYPRSR